MDFLVGLFLLIVFIFAALVMAYASGALKYLFGSKKGAAIEESPHAPAGEPPMPTYINIPSEGKRMKFQRRIMLPDNEVNFLDEHDEPKMKVNNLTAKIMNLDNWYDGKANTLEIAYEKNDPIAMAHIGEMAAMNTITQLQSRLVAHTSSLETTQVRHAEHSRRLWDKLNKGKRISTPDSSKKGSSSNESSESSDESSG